MKALEKICTRLFDKMFGRDLTTRFEKLDSEYKELLEAFENYKKEPCPKYETLLKNELADVQSVITHISNILNTSIEEQLIYTNDKLISRIGINKYRGEELTIK